MLVSRLSRPFVFPQLRFAASFTGPLPDLVDSSKLVKLLSLENENDRLHIVDTRPPNDFKNGHIPGAINMHKFYQFVVHESTPKVLGKLQKDFSKMIGDAGIQREDTVIVYEQALPKRFGASCRGYFVFKYLGCENVSVLHHGFEGWQNANLIISQAIVEPTPVEFQTRVPEGLMLTKEDIMAALEDNETVILDCRDEDEWFCRRSTPGRHEHSPRKGRIPGAKWIKWSDLMEIIHGVRQFKKPEEIRKICQNAGIKEHSKVAVYCFKGTRAANTLLALKSAGIRNVGNYFASWNEWSQDEKLPIETE